MRTISHLVSGRRLILIADRSEITRRVLREILVPSGFRVVTAATTADAARVIARLGNRLHAAVAESAPHAGAGYDFAAEISRMAPNTPLLAMSNPMPHLNGARRERTRVDETPSEIAKPFTQASLLTKLNEVLNTPRERQPATTLKYKTVSVAG